MEMVFDFHSTWYVLFFAFLMAWVVLALARRKRQGKNEAKEQLFLALSGLTVLALMEFFAVSTNLWHYTPGNWPVILWPTYLAAILFGYQLLRFIEGLLYRTAVAPRA